MSLEFFKNNFLVLTIFPLLFLAIAAGFFRFYISKDYDVTYEAACDPSAESCFIGCSDEACAETYPYFYITKRANDLFDVCGPDITDCEAALDCNNGQVECEITSCEPTEEECYKELSAN